MKRTSCPQNCPNCNEQDVQLDEGDNDYDGDLIFRHFQCQKCDTKWVEQYKFEFWTLEK